MKTLLEQWMGNNYRVVVSELVVAVADQRITVESEPSF
jgi:hypothetical protein